MPISPWYCKPEREFNFSSCFEWDKLLKRFSGSTKECATEDQTLNHNLVIISFFEIDELSRVRTCVKHFQNIYGLLFAILHHKKVTAIKQKLVKSAPFPHT